MEYDSGVFMYDPALQPVVLAKLARWGRLTESDLQTMLNPEQRLRLSEDLLKDLEWEGLVTIRVVGDEPVIAITELGRRRAEEQGQSS
jgi:hypothetical protein